MAIIVCTVLPAAPGDASVSTPSKLAYLVVSLAGLLLVWFFYYRSGILKRLGHYSNGLPEGNWKFYNEQKVLIQEGDFENGQEQGEWKFYNQAGDLEFYGPFKNGRKTGVWYKVNKNGKPKPYKY